MDIQKLNETLEFELNSTINENFADLVKSSWKKVKGKVNQVLVKNVAIAFFKKHPDLLKMVKQKFGQEATTEESKEIFEARGKGLIVLAMTLAILGGIVKPAMAADSFKMSGNRNMMAAQETSYVTNLQSLVNDLSDKNQLGSALVGSYLVGPDGNVFEVNSFDQAMKLIGDLDGPSARTILVISDNEMKGTSGLDAKDMGQFAQGRANMIGINK